MLENRLHYFMVTLDPAVAGMNEHEWATLEANVSCVAAEEFFACKNPQKIKGALLSGTKKYYDAIKVFAANKKPSGPACGGATLDRFLRSRGGW